MKVEYDMEKEKKNLKKKADKILKKYPNVIGLESVLNKMLALVDSKPFNVLTNNLVSYIKKFIEIYPEDEVDIEVLLKKFPILRYSLILNMSKDNSKSIFSRRSDTVTYTQFENFIDFNLGILAMKERDAPLYSRKRIFAISEKVMVLLEDFDKNVSFHPVNEDFFRSLDTAKWDKDARKLFKKMISIQLDIAALMITTLFSDITHDIFANYPTTLTMLATCSAVKNNRDIMEYEDVICAFRTFFKLFDADLDDLI